MKIFINFLLILLSFSIVQAKINDIIITLENISDTCQYGRRIIFQDENGDDTFDKIRITECDLSYNNFDLTIKGTGGLLSGLASDIIEGGVETLDFKIRIFNPNDDRTVAYLYYDTLSSKAVLDFSSLKINEININNKIIITLNNGIIYIKFSEINIINKEKDCKLELYDINGREVLIHPRIDFSTNTILLNVDNIQYGFYLLRLYYNNKIELFKIIITN
ncbi:MAG: hypothetical protein A2X61_05050 [Ignavibacteria bacterium GWB2_35_12]|nr:MAG: hypothetical protein A2X63_02825 [Ignavibacteria bacterium GWA2_35_8]OGU42315.1 MAG: hypothetical protein A2X61_05050 [Ignavibacteria bacterium GWB2_35_12]OGU96981.1 MAG: hypothetical protein A2220_10115 [Ignavibacteria bacterium RIFOXYA2_FULL_35_10]OGV18543.1 MAG: hypothetical protein A2475_01740 [Ignavibacteria bacterium RIFOXYC2_FULL_35_21]